MRACWYRCRVPLQNASSGCCCQSAGVAAGGGCGMSMAVWTLGPDGDDIDAVAKKRRGLGCHQKQMFLSGVYAGVLFLDSSIKVKKSIVQYPPLPSWTSWILFSPFMFSTGAGKGQEVKMMLH